MRQFGEIRWKCVVPFLLTVGCGPADSPSPDGELEVEPRAATILGAVAADFGAPGLHVYDGVELQQLAGLSPEGVAISDVVYADFGPLGLWRYDGTWTVLVSADTDHRLPLGAGVVAHSPGLGVWHFDGAQWNAVTLSRAEGLRRHGSGMLVDAGADGLMFYDPPETTVLSPMDATAMASWNGEVVASLSEDDVDQGIFLHDGVVWTELSSLGAEALVPDGESLLADLGPSGLARYTVADGWETLSPDDPHLIAPVGGEIVAAFDEQGVRVYNGSTWAQLSASRADGLEVWNDALLLDLGRDGLWHYANGTLEQWTELDLDELDAGHAESGDQPEPVGLVAQLTLPPWAYVGETVRGRVDAWSDAGPMTSFIVSAPHGMTLAPDGSLEWTPTDADAGEHLVVVAATDGVRQLLRGTMITVSGVGVEASATISAALGGTVSVTNPASPLFGVELTLPPGALEADTTISIGVASTLPPPGDYPPIGPGIALYPAGLGLLAQATLSVPFDEAQLPAGFTTEAAAAYQYVGDSGLHSLQAQGWVPAPSQYQPSQAMIEAQIHRLSGIITGADDFPLFGANYTTPEGHFVVQYYVDSPPNAVDDEYLPARPGYVEEVGTALESAFAAYALEGYAVSRPAGFGPTIVRIRPVPPFVGESFTDLHAVQLFIDPALDSDDLRLTAAHELFHLCEIRALDSDVFTAVGLFALYIPLFPTFVSLLENVAEYAAIRISGFDDPPYINALPNVLMLDNVERILNGGATWFNIDAPRVSFPTLVYLDQALPELRYVWDLFAVEESSGAARVPRIEDWLPSGKPPFVEDFYDQVRAAAGSPEAHIDLWLRFSECHHFARDPACIADIDKWLASDRAQASERPTGDERKITPTRALIDPLHSSSPDLRLGPGGVLSYLVELDELFCDGCPGSDPEVAERADLVFLADAWAPGAVTSSRAWGRAQLVDARDIPTPDAAVPIDGLERFRLADRLVDDDAYPRIKLDQFADCDQEVCTHRYDLLVTVFNEVTPPYTTAPNGQIKPLDLQVYFEPNGVEELAVGTWFTCGIGSGSGVRCWGRNDVGQLGNGGASSQTCGEDVEAGERHSKINIGFGSQTCDGLAMDIVFDDVTSTGAAVYPCSRGAVTAAGPFASVAAGGNHACALDEAGLAWCWGDNEQGQAGPNANETCQRALPGPAYVDTPCATVPSLVSATLHFDSITAGAFHTCAHERDDNRVYCWGYNGQGALGRDVSFGPNPDPQLAAWFYTFERLIPSGSAAHSCGVTPDGRVFCWGSNSAHQLAPVNIFACNCLPGGRWMGTDVDYVSVSFNSVCTSDSSAAVACTGHLEDWQPPAGTEVAHVGQTQSTCYSTRGGEVWCEGSNPFGELGNGSWDADISSGPHPSARVTAVRGVRDLQVGNHVCTRDAWDRVQCWGRNFSGETSGLGQLCFAPDLDFDCPEEAPYCHSSGGQCNISPVPGAYCTPSPVNALQ